MIFPPCEPGQRAMLLGVAFLAYNRRSTLNCAGWRPRGCPAGGAVFALSLQRNVWRGTETLKPAAPSGPQNRWMMPTPAANWLCDHDGADWKACPNVAGAVVT